MLVKVLTLLLAFASLYGKVELGVDRLFGDREVSTCLNGKRVGLITNHTGQSAKLESTLDLFERNAITYKLVAVFAPEHGLNGASGAWESVEEESRPSGLPVYSLYGKTRRPTKAQLEGIDLLVFDIQDIGSRTYTYATTLFYAMEEAAKAGIKVLVLDRPNPINGLVVDGPVLEEGVRSFVGYLQIPLCHGMTIGELALYFNAEYKVGCALEVVPMKGWKRNMTLSDCDLPWVPMSPHIPDKETPYYFPATGLIGEALSNVSIGVGYTLPFKVVGAPWIESSRLAKALNEQNFPGMTFQPFDFSPFFGQFKEQMCHGVRLVVTDHAAYKPVSTAWLILGMLKSLYPEKFREGIRTSNLGVKMLAQVSGTPEVHRILTQEAYISWPLIGLHEKEREVFKAKRERYLLYE